MIESLLIANRGEIARRIQRTCRDMGIRSIAVYSDADRDLPGIAEADWAVRLGPAPAAESYLDMEKLLAAAVGNGADAIHPGYGFLSENARFSELCQERGVVFVGPGPEAIRAMGDKAEAKRRMAQAGVPVLPGYAGEEANGPADMARLGSQAERVGYPLLVKAVAGGGGRGIRLVEHARHLAAAVESAQREAASAFEDRRVMLERYIPAPHHVEFQVLADTHGAVLHLYERECSVQRRHQKIVEEAPSPILTPELRSAMAEAALKGAKAIGYVGAGTVEFLVDGEGRFFFLEMNTRLQVEHPVTEAILGLDLVRLQIEIAEGRPLAIRQEQLAPRGAAIECRLNAEDPRRGFLPSVGCLARLKFPSGPGLRVDTGFAAGCVVSPHYDSLLAKLIAWGANREEAMRRMRRMLERTQVAGIPSNLPLLQAICAHPEFTRGDYTTRFLETHEAALLSPPVNAALLREQVLALCAVEARLSARRSAPADPGSPWAGTAGPGNAAGVVATLSRVLTLGEAEHAVTIRVLPPGVAGHGGTGPHDAQRDRRPLAQGTGGMVRGTENTGALALSVEWRGATHRLRCDPSPDGAPGDERLALDLEGVRLEAAAYAEGAWRWLSLRGMHVMATSRDPAEDLGAVAAADADRLQAPLPGKVVKIAVKAGQSVAAGEVLVLLEAMKVEHQITAPHAGRIKALRFKEGDSVQRGDALVEME